MQTTESSDTDARCKLSSLLERALWIGGGLLCIGFISRAFDHRIGLIAGSFALGFASLFLTFSLIAFLRLRQQEERVLAAWEADHARASENIVAALGELKASLDRQWELVKTAKATPAKATTDGGGKPKDLSNLSTAELLEQLTAAKKMGEADEVLDLRESLIPRLSESKLLQIDTELANWVMQHFQRSLRAGKAALVAESLGRAVKALEHIELIQRLTASLPTIRRSAGLCVECAKPYRGEDGVCPPCRDAKLVAFEAEDDVELDDAEVDK